MEVPRTLTKTFASELFGKFSWNACFSAQAQVKWSAQIVRWNRESKLLSSACECVVERAGGFGNSLDLPLQQLLHGTHSGGQQREIRSFTHVEAASADVVIIGV